MNTSNPNPPPLPPLPPGLLDDARRAIEGRRFAPARAALQRLLRTHAQHPEVTDAMRTLLSAEGQWAQALHYAQETARLAPDHPGVWASLAVVCSELKRDDEAIAAARKVIELDPSLVEAHLSLGSACLRAGRLIDAQEAAATGLKVDPNDRGLIFLLAAALLEQGRAERSVAVLASGLFNDAGDERLAGFLCTVSNYMSPVDRKAIIARHRNFGRIAAMLDMARPFTHSFTPQRLPGDPGPHGPWAGRGRGGRVRVAIMSSDLRSHSVAFFLEPIIDHLDRSRFELVGYPTAPKHDEVTRRFKERITREGGPNAWRTFEATDDRRAAKQIVDDRIDILIDTNGLTAGERTDILRLKPAPVILTALGYPNTTGLATVDWRLVDSITDPPPHAGGIDDAVERLARLDPCFLCYRPPDNPPAPAMPAGPGIVFCSFNALIKYTDAALALWARVLHAVPGSSLLLKAQGLKDPRTAQAAVDRLAQLGIAPDRITTAGFAPGIDAHLRVYHQAHIALDTFPYGGTTTTCEALLMGVPVVSLAPPPPAGMHAARVGASLLSAIGMPELAVPTEDEFVAVATRLAADHAALARLRTTLRPRLLASPLCDQPGYAQRFGLMLSRMWTDWCERAAPPAPPGAGLKTF